MSQTPPVKQPETYGRPSSGWSISVIDTEIKRREDIPLEMRLVQMDQVASTGQQSSLPTCLHIWRPAPSQTVTESMLTSTAVTLESFALI